MASSDCTGKHASCELEVLPGSQETATAHLATAHFHALQRQGNRTSSAKLSKLSSASHVSDLDFAFARAATSELSTPAAASKALGSMDIALMPSDSTFHTAIYC